MIKIRQLSPTVNYCHNIKTKFVKTSNQIDNWVIIEPLDDPLEGVLSDEGVESDSGEKIEFKLEVNNM